MPKVVRREINSPLTWADLLFEADERGYELCHIPNDALPSDRLPNASYTDIKLLCNHNHEWKTNVRNFIFSRSDCPLCVRRKYSDSRRGKPQKRTTFEEVIAAGKIRGFSLVDNQRHLPPRTFTRYQWRCEECLYTFWRPYGDMIRSKRQGGCKQCYNNGKCVTIEEAAADAESRGLTLLPGQQMDRKLGIYTRLTFQCNDPKCGCIYTTAVSNVRFGNGCPECPWFKFVNEKIMRECVNRLFPVPAGAEPKFVKSRPAFLGGRLEYDAFCAELRIAVEYQGYHHFVFPNNFHRTQEQFDTQQERDQRKRRLSAENGVLLIEVLSSAHRPEQIMSSLVDQLLAAGVSIPNWPGAVVPLVADVSGPLAPPVPPATSAPAPVTLRTSSGVHVVAVVDEDPQPETPQASASLVPLPGVEPITVWSSSGKHEATAWNYDDEPKVASERSGTRFVQSDIRKLFHRSVMEERIEK
eukprot:gnl/Hemi2/25200_TR8472_c0_g3_i1.p1 gnl/Hemi2/25200_TR8472_c0_g3~~gnl/Hemi2/25200_TR8472_c0_g3_i1.p1  ORF type:complete len:469 (+),score=-27.80 gnl/Hemi2/25200_TR8472_c0_g3_i1:155-1561(+)